MIIIVSSSRYLSLEIQNQVRRSLIVSDRILACISLAGHREVGNSNNSKVIFQK
jgi:hypothetical protein